MAYTYNDFLQAAGRANMLQAFKPSDLEVTKANPEYGLSMLSLMRDRDQATTPEMRLLANEGIRQLQDTYGVARDAIAPVPAAAASYGALETGHTSETTPENGNASGSTKPESGFVYENEDAYQALLSAVNNPRYTYDMEQDPVWKALRRSYLREGDRAMQDALAKASTVTGGVPSSYAVTAAQQAAANYNEKLVDMIPTLEQNAYERFWNDRSMQEELLSWYEKDRERAYQEWVARLQNLAANSFANEVAAGVAINGLNGVSHEPMSENDLMNLIMSGMANDIAAGVAIHGLDGVPPGTPDPQLSPTGESVEDATSVDMSTLWELGYGMYSAEQIAALVANGTLEQYVENGVLKFRKGSQRTNFPGMGG